jgi:hypothetical protein
MAKKSTTRASRRAKAPGARPARTGGLNDLLWRIDRLERQVMRLSELVRAHAEDEDRLVRIVAQDHDALRRELIERDGDGGPVPGSSRLKPVRDKVGLVRWEKRVT